MRIIRNSVLIFGCLWIALGCGVLVAAQQDDPSPEAQSRDDKGGPNRGSDESSSKDTRIDLSAPKDDERTHPQSAAAISDAEDSASDVKELHPWDPHKALKDIEVGDFYFKKKNYRAALNRYKEALVYKPNDAIANFRLAECSEKLNNPADAVTHYQEYLKILPHGPFAVDAQKALARLKADEPKTSSSAQ